MGRSFITDFSQKVLGISLGERSLIAAEMTGDASGVPVRAVEFIYPADLNYERPESLGAGLHEFLREQNFSARRVVFGVPAKWLLIKPHEIPPTDAQTAASMLWLAATTQASPELGALVFDFAGESSELRAKPVVLMGLQQRWIDRLLSLATAAKLKPIAITPTAIALAGITAEHLAASLLLSVRREAAELVCLDGGEVRSIRQVAATGSIQPVMAELRRAVMTRAGGGGVQSQIRIGLSASDDTLVLWDDVGLEPTMFDSLREGTGLTAIRADPAWIADGVVLPSSPTSRFNAGSAIALVAAACRGQKLAVDFLHPRLRPPKVERFSRKAIAAAGTVGVVLILAVTVLAGVTRLQNEVSKSEQQLQSLQPAIARAKPFVASMQFAESFQAGKPRYIACLRDLTLALPADGQAWFTSFRLQMNMHGEVVGRSSNDQNVLGLIDKLSAGGQFKDISRKIDSHEAKGNASKVAFTLTFTYVPAK